MNIPEFPVPTTVDVDYWNRWKYETDISGGGFGFVIMISDRATGATFALKLFNAGSLGDTVNRELRIAMYLSKECESIVKHYELVYVPDPRDPAVPPVYALRMALISGDDLFTLQKRPDFRDYISTGDMHRFPYELIRSMAKQLRCMHRHGVVHRDVKQENVLYRQRTGPGGSLEHTFYLIDFGLAIETDTKAAKQPMRGTLDFMAPESIANRIEDPTKLDIWSLGVMLLELFIGGIFVELDRKAPREKMLEDIKKSIQLYETYSIFDPNPAITELVWKLLSWDPKDRPTANQIYEEINVLEQEAMAKRVPAPAILCSHCVRFTTHLCACCQRPFCSKRCQNAAH